MDDNNFYQDHTEDVVFTQPTHPEPQKSPANALQIVGLVFGILSIVACCCYGIPGVIFSIVGFICSVIGNKRGKHGIGTAGLICSIIGFVLSVLSTCLFVLVIGEAIQSGEFQDAMQEFYNY